VISILPRGNKWLIALGLALHPLNVTQFVYQSFIPDAVLLHFRLFLFLIFFCILVTPWADDARTERTKLIMMNENEQQDKGDSVVGKWTLSVALVFHDRHTPKIWCNNLAINWILWVLALKAES
jgi:hypothetical protein